MLSYSFMRTVRTFSVGMPSLHTWQQLGKWPKCRIRSHSPVRHHLLRIMRDGQFCGHCAAAVAARSPGSWTSGHPEAGRRSSLSPHNPPGPHKTRQTDPKCRARKCQTFAILGFNSNPPKSMLAHYAHASLPYHRSQQKARSSNRRIAPHASRSVGSAP